jgi:membrane protein YqaA with SNARE-associated domain
VIVFHHLGWDSFTSDSPHWLPMQRGTGAWVAKYGALALLRVATSPLPHTPALIAFGIVRHDYFTVFMGMPAGKSLKYGLFAWLAYRFPERFGNSIARILHDRRCP